jgi:hypothetical protein
MSSAGSVHVKISMRPAPNVSRETSPYGRRLRQGTRALFRATVSSRAHSANPSELKESVGLPNSERCTATVLERPYLRPCIAIQPPQHLYPSQSRAGVAQRIDPRAEPAWPNESTPWRVVPNCTSRRQRRRTCPSLVGTCPDASLPFTRSCCTSRHALPYASVAIALVVALAVTVAVAVASS